MTTPADRIEAAAQLLHERRHRAGTGQVCGACRDDAAAVARVLTFGAAPVSSCPAAECDHQWQQHTAREYDTVGMPVSPVCSVPGCACGEGHRAFVQRTDYRVGDHPFDAFEARCETCRIAVGPLTQSTATAWVQGHNSTPAEDNTPPVFGVQQIDGGFVVTWTHGAASGGQTFAYPT